MLVRPAAYRRTFLAAILVAAAVLLPTTAWFVSGSHDASRRASSQYDQAFDDIDRRLKAGANRLAARLTTLIARESARPFYHYQTLYHDPRGAAQGLAVTRSPLATGYSDPLVLAHFQLDEMGTVSLPTVNERFPELSTDEGFADFCAVLTELQNGLVMTDVAHSNTGRDGAQEHVLERETWEQIHFAEAVYAALTGNSAGEQQPSVHAGVDAVDSITVRVSPLRWRTIVLGSGPALAALREVDTPDGMLVQGFTLATEAVAEWLGIDDGFVPMMPLAEDEVSTPVADTGWWLTSDAGPALDHARNSGQQIRAQFRRRFLVSSAAVLFAALAVVLIVAQTDRLARQRARFAAAAAHELKTPLATLGLHSEMLADGLGNPDHERRYAEQIAVEVRRLGRVVANMLDLSRLERGITLAHPSVGDIAQATTDCVDRLRPTLELAGLKVEVDIASDLPSAKFDRDALCQIVDNLLDNAEKHTRSAEDRRAIIRATSDETDVRLTIADNGPGIPRALQRDLFRPFARTSEGVAGLGLGLAVARSLARAQGGELEIADGPAGATFVLTLPRA